MALPARAVELWIAPTGNDAGAGTSNQPFATLARAQQKARELRQPGNTDNNGPIHIVLRGGIYQVADALRLSAADSGTENVPLVFEAASDEAPILSGGVEIGGWKLAGDVAGLPPVARGKIWVADLPKINGHFFEFRQLWVNNSKTIRAREPNGDTLSPLVRWDKV